MKAMTKKDLMKIINSLKKYSGPLQAIVDGKIHYYEAWLNYYNAMSSD